MRGIVLLVVVGFVAVWCGEVKEKVKEANEFVKEKVHEVAEEVKHTAKPKIAENVRKIEKVLDPEKLKEKAAHVGSATLESAERAKEKAEATWTETKEQLREAKENVQERAEFVEERIREGLHNIEKGTQDAQHTFDDFANDFSTNDYFEHIKTEGLRDIPERGGLMYNRAYNLVRLINPRHGKEAEAEKITKSIHAHMKRLYVIEMNLVKLILKRDELKTGFWLLEYSKTEEIERMTNEIKVLEGSLMQAFGYILTEIEKAKPLCGPFSWLFFYDMISVFTYVVEQTGDGLSYLLTRSWFEFLLLLPIMAGMAWGGYQFYRFMSPFVLIFLGLFVVLWALRLPVLLVFTYHANLFEALALLLVGWGVAIACLYAIRVVFEASDKTFLITSTHITTRTQTTYQSQPYSQSSSESEDSRKKVE